MGKHNGTKSAGLVGDVCLYGNRDRGFHYLARVGERGELLQAGDPDAYPADRAACVEKRGTFGTQSEAIWHAIAAMRDRGLPRRGLVRLYAPGGTMVADVDVSAHVPSFGSLGWRPATVSEHVPVEG